MCCLSRCKLHLSQHKENAGNCEVRGGDRTTRHQRLVGESESGSRDHIQRL